MALTGGEIGVKIDGPVATVTLSNGPHTVTFAPSLISAHMSERATRL